MRQRLFTLLIAALCVSPVMMIACGDDSSDVDMSGPDLAAGGMDSCLQIVTCAQTCSGAAACIQACIAKGSAAAQGKFTALSTCSYGQCTTAKDGGAAACTSATDTSAGCIACVTASGQSMACSTQLGACLAP